MTAIDTLLGRVTMYRLVTVCLLVISATALGLSIAGQIFYTPGALALSGLVAVAASVTSARVFAALARTTAHTESAIVTGLLLFLLFWPTTELRYLAVLALAAVVANASKYLIAVRGRHVLNPAAAGALVIGLTRLDVPVWWVADRLLLPVVALGALAVLWRTRRLLMAGVFLVVAVTLVVIRLANAGQDLGSALSTALTSYPVVFLVGFMLSEPLTLPPRRYQQIVEAAGVAVLFAVPFTVGPVNGTPELALVIGNVFAFWCGQRRGLRVELVSSTALTPTAYELRFRSLAAPRFWPGQFVELTVPHAGADARGVRRTFSISSAPALAASGAGEFSIAFTTPERSSTYKRALLALPPGSTLHATGIGGDFLLPADPGTPLLLVAGGIGITPFASQLAALAAERADGAEPRDVVLVYAVRAPDELAYADVLTRAGARVLVLAPEPPADLPAGWHYLGAGRLTAEHLAEAVPDADQRRAYVSGPPGMVGHTRRLLHRAGVRRVRTDAFSGY
ncbi:FAD-dependent oxidoreductase [Cellulomonas hominis]